MSLLELLHDQVVNEELCQLISLEDAIRVYKALKGKKFPCQFRLYDGTGRLLIFKEINDRTIRIYPLIKGNDSARIFFNAAQKGDIEVVQGFLESGMYVDIQNYEQLTPFYMASFYHQKEIVKLLYEWGANVDFVSPYGYTALSMAAYSQDIDLVSILLERGANVNQITNDERTPLMYAAAGGNIALAKKLLEYGANIHYIDSEGNTPLSIAYKYGKRDMVKFLVEHGADMGSLQRSYLNRLYDYTYEYTGGIRSALNRLDRIFID